MKSKFLSLGMLLLAACTSEIEEQSVPSSFESVTMSAKDFECEKSGRTSFEITDQGAGFSWAANDTVGIFPEEGAQAYFPMVEGAGTKTATFTGGGWALKPSSKYMAYYPMQGKFYLDKTAIPVDYTGQTQTGNASTAHLGQYDYMAAVGTSPQKGKVNFDFDHLGALLQLNLYLPDVSAYKSVSLTCNEPVFIQHGEVDITAQTSKVISVGQKSTEIKVNLRDFPSSPVNGEVKIYFLTAPVDLTGKILKVVADNGKQVNLGSIAIYKSWKAGHIYALHITGDLGPIGEWVDLGLPSRTLWAACNIGASRAEEYGDYFAWGEISPKKSYDESNSLTCNQMMTDFSGNPQYDAATADRGEGARMPNKYECYELHEYCTEAWSSINGVNGKLFTGPNGNCIFLPAAGYRSQVSLYNNGSYGYYWSATPQSGYSSDNNWSKAITFEYNLKVDDRFRSNGYSVRPVRSPERLKSVIEWVDLGLPSGIKWATCNVGATKPEEFGEYFAWGEVCPKAGYDQENSLTYDKPMQDISGNPQYDAATASWGKPARLPKFSEIQELIDNCTSEWTTLNGVKGRLVRGPNGKTIFLPAAGRWFGVTNGSKGSSALYLGSTSDNCYTNAYCLLIDNRVGSGYGFDWRIYDRYSGLSVRPVRDK